MKFMRMIPATAIRKIYLVIPLIFLAVSAFAQSPPAKILYVGAISINPCQDAKVLADWYSRFGIETKECRGGYYGKLDTAAGLFAFGIHPKKADAPKKCSPSVSVVFRVENFEGSLLAAKSKGLLPDSTEKDPDQGQFAHFHDPDGNEVTIWGK
jgi:predicted enzyme related to lactoylglutathione lyase